MRSPFGLLANPAWRRAEWSHAVAWLRHVSTSRSVARHDGTHAPPAARRATSASFRPQPATPVGEAWPGRSAAEMGWSLDSPTIVRSLDVNQRRIRRGVKLGVSLERVWRPEGGAVQP